MNEVEKRAKRIDKIFGIEGLSNQEIDKVIELMNKDPVFRANVEIFAKEEEISLEAFLLRMCFILIEQRNLYFDQIVEIRKAFGNLKGSFDKKEQETNKA